MPDLPVGADTRSMALNAHSEPRIRLGLNLAIAAVLFVVAFRVALSPSWVDLPLTVRFNSLAGHYPVLDLMFYELDNGSTFSGAVLIALVWGCWFGSEDREMRTRILAGTVASFAAAIVSRRLQHLLPTHVRPYYDTAVNMHHPLYMSHWPLNTWYSFPSDHMAMFGGLLTVVWFAGSKFRIPATVWLCFVESSRVYEGAHFPSDLFGGAALAAGVVWASQSAPILRLSRWVMKFEISAPSLFYIAAFFMSFQIATLFGDLRNTGYELKTLYRNHELLSPARAPTAPTAPQ